MLEQIERCRHFYEKACQGYCKSGLSVSAAIEECAHDYLDGKPKKKGFSNLERSQAFWMCDFWDNAPADGYNTEAVALALGQALYFGIDDADIIERVGRISPENLMDAIRRSQIFLQTESLVWHRFVKMASSYPQTYGNFIKACNHLSSTISSLKQAIHEKQKPLEDLTVFEILLYGSVFTFKALAGFDVMSSNPEDNPDELLQEIADILNHLLIWKVETRPENDLKLSERFIEKSFKNHLFPLLYPSRGAANPCLDNLELFSDLAKAIKNLNEFRMRVLVVFCYDEDYSWSYYDEQFDLKQMDRTREIEWEKNGRKLYPLHQYWLIRAMIDYENSNLSDIPFGKQENDKYNREAYLKAKMALLQLIEVYGFDVDLELENGNRIELINLLHPIEMITTLFKVEHIAAFHNYYMESGNWLAALRNLADSGYFRKKIRYPLVWAECKEKANSFLPWTVSAMYPSGNIDHAINILDFWINDLQETSERITRKKASAIPYLNEKPIMKLGRYCLQLPWLIATQNNSIAIINNLRRIGRNRLSRLEETHRIETRLRELFEERGFAVVESYQPEHRGNNDPGEVDLLCFRDDYLFILELKSGYRRKTLQDAWVHKTITLRKASRQLQRKKTAISDAITSNMDLRTKLGISDSDNPIKTYAWIVDTSIEYDQSYINGFLKVSLEGLRIILRDEQHFLSNDILKHGPPTRLTLYPEGFSAERFVEIVENGELWSGLDGPH